MFAFDKIINIINNIIIKSNRLTKKVLKIKESILNIKPAATRHLDTYRHETTLSVQV